MVTKRTSTLAYLEVVLHLVFNPCDAVGVLSFSVSLSLYPLRIWSITLETDGRDFKGVR